MSKSSLLLPAGETIRKDSTNWGYPGYLVQSEFDVYEKLEDELKKRNDDELNETVYRSFGEFEDRHYALCRWLRARKFILNDTITMIEEATEMRRVPKRLDFFPTACDALGCRKSVYLKQYPQVCVGHCKSGHPVYFSKPGELCVNGLECVTTIQGVLNYHWHDMIHNFGGMLKKTACSKDGYKRFEFVCIIDLSGLTPAKLNKRALNIVKVQSQIDSLCFPETLNRMIVVNAPGFFSVTWRLIKGWIDARTANKVEIYSSRKKWEKRLLELIERDNLPSDYGGDFASTDQIMQQDLGVVTKGCFREVVQMLAVRGTAHIDIDLDIKETLELAVRTRCRSETVFTVNDIAAKSVIQKKKVNHIGTGGNEGENIDPTAIFFHPVSGPGRFRIEAICSAGRFSVENFMIVGSVYRHDITNASRHCTAPQREEQRPFENDPIDQESITTGRSTPSPENVSLKDQIYVVPSRHAHSASTKMQNDRDDDSVSTPWMCGLNIPTLKELLLRSSKKRLSKSDETI